MKKRYGIGTAFTVALAMAALTACGSANTSMYSDMAKMEKYESAYDTASYDGGGGVAVNSVAGEAGEYGYDDAEAAAEEAPTQTQEASSEVSESALAGRKLIKNVDLNVETEQFDALLPGLEQQIAALGGYIENMSTYSRGNSYPTDYIGTKYLRYANMTLRIPKENLEAFLADMGEQTNIVSRSESVTDVTLQYVDLESHKKALSTEQDRLLELMEKAESVEDIIAIEGRLSEVRYRIESMESQLRTYDNQIDYSTVYLVIDEVERYTPGETASMGERISAGFMNSLRGVGRDIVDCVIWVLINFPYLVMWAVIITVLALILRIIWKMAAKRIATKRQKGVGSCPVRRFLRAHKAGKDNHAGQEAESGEKADNDIN